MTSLLATTNHQGNPNIVNNTANNKSPQHQQAHRRSQQQLAMQQQYQSRKNKSFSGNSCLSLGGNVGLNANDLNNGAGSSSGESNARGESSGGRNAMHRVAQYTLNDVKFVEELGEGAFGNTFFLFPFDYEIIKLFLLF